MYRVKFYGNGAKSGKMETIETENGKYTRLPANKFTRPGFKFVGWSLVKNNKINLSHLQLGKPKYKNKGKLKGKDDSTVKLYACWKGTGPEAAAIWARLIAADNSFHYGKPGKGEYKWHGGRDRSHQNGCYFCGTTRTGYKKAKKGSKWEKTYCCNAFAFASYVHGANIRSKCVSSGLSIDWWKKHGFRLAYKSVVVSKLKPGDLLLRPSHHIVVYVGKAKSGTPMIAHAAGSKNGWKNSSIRVNALRKTVKTGYVVLRLKGKK